MINRMGESEKRKVRKSHAMTPSIRAIAPQLIRYITQSGRLLNNYMSLRYWNQRGHHLEKPLQLGDARRNYTSTTSQL